MKVIWRGPCKSYFPLLGKSPVDFFLCQVFLCTHASVFAIFLKLLPAPPPFFFPLRSRGLFSWPHFCISLAVLMPMSAIAHTLNFIYMLKFLYLLWYLWREKIAEPLKKCRNSFQPKKFSWGLESAQMLIRTLDDFQFSHILCCSESDILHCCRYSAT